MKYYFDPSFKVVNKNRYANLIKYLFFHYDQFVAEVIGNDFGQSVYRDILYRSAKYDYWKYRKNRAYEYKKCRRFGTAFKVKELISFQEFERGFKPPVVDAELSCLKFFNHIMGDMFIYSSIVHDQNGRCFKLEENGAGLFKSVISSIITERFPSVHLESKNDPFDRSVYTATMSPDVREFLPAYMFVFKLLKKKKLKFKHITVSASSFPKLKEMLKKYSTELEIERMLVRRPSSFADDVIERLLSNRKESKKQTEIKKLLSLPVIMEAYFNVYGDLPSEAIFPRFK